MELSHVLALAVAAGIHGDDHEEVLQLLDGDVEYGHVLPVSMKQHKGAPLAARLVMYPDPVDIGEQGYHNERRQYV